MLNSKASVAYWLMGWTGNRRVAKNVDGGGGVVVQHSPTSSSPDEVPLSKAPETPACSRVLLTAPRLPTAPGVPVWTSNRVTPLSVDGGSGSRMGQRQRKDFPPKRDNKG